MDNFTHSLAGWALGQAGLKTRTRKGLAALILGANAPDIDVFFQWAPWEPLATHRGFTHSLIGGVIILPLMLWGLLLALDRLQIARGARFKSGLALHPVWLLALCYLGALTHPLLDLQTTYAVQLFSPLSGLWYHSDSLFIIDVWLWSLLALAIAHSRKREARGQEWRRPVQGALLAALAYIGVNIGLSDGVHAAVKAHSPRADAIFASPPPVLFWRRDIIWREDGRYRLARFSPFRGMTFGRGSLDPMLDDPVVQQAMHRRRFDKFLHWSILPIASVERDGCLARVDLGDARYLSRGRKSRLGREETVPLPC